MNGRFYLYELLGKYDPVTKKTKKVTGKYLGRITQSEGFIPKQEKKETCVKILDGQCPNVEFGFYHFFTKHVKEKFEPLLRKHFPDHWQTLIAASYCRAMWQCPINRMESYYRRSYMSVAYPQGNVEQKNMTGCLRDMAKLRENIVLFCRELLGEASTLIFDGTDMVTSSRLMKMSSLQRTKKGCYDNVFTIMMCYSPDERLPIFYQIFPGKTKDMTAIKDTLGSLLVDKDKTMVVADENLGTELDKGFASESNLSKLENMKIRYVVALKRNDAHIDYSCLKMRDNSLMDVAFEYEGRTIWGKEIGAWDGAHPDRKVYLYLDEELARKEMEDFVVHNGGKQGTEEYRKKYAEACLKFGTIAMVSNKRAGDPATKEGKEKKKKKATTGQSMQEKIYYSYKERGTVEDMISVFKTDLDAEGSRMQDEGALEGWVFINLLGVVWHYVMRNLIMDMGLLHKYSPKYLFSLFEGVRKIKVAGEWKLTQITKKDQKVLKKLDLLPEMDPDFSFADNEGNSDDADNVEA